MEYSKMAERLCSTLATTCIIPRVRSHSLLLHSSNCRQLAELPSGPEVELSPGHSANFLQPKPACGCLAVRISILQGNGDGHALRVSMRNQLDGVGHGMDLFHRQRRIERQ